MIVLCSYFRTILQFINVLLRNPRNPPRLLATQTHQSISDRTWNLQASLNVLLLHVQLMTYLLRSLFAFLEQNLEGFSYYRCMLVLIFSYQRFLCRQNVSSLQKPSTRYVNYKYFLKDEIKKILTKKLRPLKTEN